jgi:hypothetical protein
MYNLVKLYLAETGQLFGWHGISTPCILFLHIYVFQIQRKKVELQDLRVDEDEHGVPKGEKWPDPGKDVTDDVANHV